jgi:glycosyltransferase involved in cell wall biosynthesis
MGKPENKIVLDLRPLQTGYAKRGIGRYTEELAKGLSEKCDFLYSLIFNHLENPMPQVPIWIQVPPKKRQWLWDQTVLPFLLWKYRISLFHNFVALGPLDKISFPGLFASKCIATIHDLHMFEEKASDINRFYRNTKRIRFQEKFVPRLFHCAVDSEFTREKVLERFPISKNKVTEVPVGADHLLRNNSTNDIAGLEALPEKFILSLGDTDNKNLSLSFKILQRLREQIPDLNWVVCGRKTHAKIHPNKTPDHFPWIHFIKFVDDPGLTVLYKKAQLLLFPSIEEGFGVPVAEAMHLKCPVVASSIEPLISILGYDPGLNPKDDSKQSLENWTHTAWEILTNSKKREALIKRHNEHVQYYRWQTAVDKILEIYKSAGILNTK